MTYFSELAAMLGNPRRKKRDHFSVVTLVNHRDYISLKIECFFILTI